MSVGTYMSFKVGKAVAIWTGSRSLPPRPSADELEDVSLLWSECVLC